MMRNVRWCIIHHAAAKLLPLLQRCHKAAACYHSTMLDKPVSQKLPVARCYGTYVKNGNTPHHTLYDEEC
jgi:hypothetical protein